MATWAELQSYEARDEAIEEAYHRVLGEIEEGIAGKLDSAEGGLVASMMLVAEACGAAPERIETIRERLEVGAKNVVQSIFRAAVEEVGKEVAARTVAESAGETARAATEKELREQALKSAMGRAERMPLVSRRSNPLKKRHLDAGRKR